MKQPRVSVIMTTYNHERYVEQAINSVLQQSTDFGVELLIGEDCSHDGTLHLCRKYADAHPERIKLFAATSNRGLINNYFSLLEAACGEYITDCSGDDFWTDPLKLQKQVNALDAHPTAVMIHTNWSELNATTNTSHPSMRKNPYGTEFITPGRNLLAPRLYMVDKVAIQLCTACFRREPLMEFYYTHKELFRGDTIPCEDLPITVALCSLGDVLFLNTDTLCYRITGESITSTPNPLKQYIFTHQRTELTHSLGKLFGSTPKWELYAYGRLFQSQLRNLLATSERQKVNDILAQAARVGYDLSLAQKCLVIILRNKPLFLIQAGIRKLYHHIKR